MGRKLKIMADCRRDSDDGFEQRGYGGGWDNKGGGYGLGSNGGFGYVSGDGCGTSSHSDTAGDGYSVGLREVHE